MPSKNSKCEFIVNILIEFYVAFAVNKSQDSDLEGTLKVI